MKSNSNRKAGRRLGEAQGSASLARRLIRLKMAIDGSITNAFGYALDGNKAGARECTNQCRKHLDAFDAEMPNP